MGTNRPEPCKDPAGIVSDDSIHRGITQVETCAGKNPSDQYCYQVIDDVIYF
ncbi:MAG: hypothetical protein NC825_05805 [Candidatus Omnitrophica bacterium]|nr:hypothetical protein [Candidatus Omnitrophota bacterium]